MIRAAFLFLALLAAPAAAHEGMFPATYLRNFDGDTATVRIDLGLGFSVVETIRMLGIDTPEIHGHCEGEKIAAHRAKRRLAELLRGPIMLQITDRDKYGRLLARVYAGGEDVAQRMIGEGLGRAYEGGHRDGWCE